MPHAGFPTQVEALYYNRTDLTGQALRDGWYWSGDLGFVVDGELYVVGRKKDLIIAAGKNIFPQDIEEIVSSHPAIHDGRAVAFGLYNPELGTEDIIVIAEAEHEVELSKCPRDRSRASECHRRRARRGASGSLRQATTIDRQEHGRQTRTLHDTRKAHRRTSRTSRLNRHE